MTQGKLTRVMRVYLGKIVNALLVQFHCRRPWWGSRYPCPGRSLPPMCPNSRQAPPVKPGLACRPVGNVSRPMPGRQESVASWLSLVKPGSVWTMRYAAGLSTRYRFYRHQSANGRAFGFRFRRFPPVPPMLPLPYGNCDRSMFRVLGRLGEQVVEVLRLHDPG